MTLEESEKAVKHGWSVFKELNQKWKKKKDESCFFLLTS